MFSSDVHGLALPMTTLCEVQHAKQRNWAKVNPLLYQWISLPWLHLELWLDALSGPIRLPPPHINCVPDSHQSNGPVTARYPIAALKAGGSESRGCKLLSTMVEVPQHPLFLWADFWKHSAEQILCTFGTAMVSLRATSNACPISRNGTVTTFSQPKRFFAVGLTKQCHHRRPMVVDPSDGRINKFILDKAVCAHKLPTWNQYLALLIHMSICFFLVFEVFSLLCAMFCAAGTALLSKYFLAQVCHVFDSGCWLSWPKNCKGKGYLDFMTKMAQVFSLKFKYQQRECQKKKMGGGLVRELYIVRLKS